MIVDSVLRRAVGEGSYIRVITISQDSYSVWTKDLGQKIGRPKGAITGGPGVVGVAVQSMNKHDVNQRLFGATVDLSQPVLLHARGKVRHGSNCPQLDVDRN